MSDRDCPTPAVVFKAIPEFPGYFGSDDGHVWSDRKGPRKRLSEWINPQGYPSVGPVRDGIQIKWPVARFIALAFHGLPGPGLICTHLDGDKMNNLPGNLAWRSYSENMRDITRHGGRSLEISEIHEIREAIEAGEVYSEIAARFGVGGSIVKDIARGGSYAWVANADGSTYQFRRRMAEYATPGQRDRLCELISGGVSLRSAASMVGITKNQAFRASKARFGVRDESRSLRRRLGATSGGPKPHR